MKLLLLTLSLTGIMSLSARDIHVSNLNGKDTNSGKTADTALLTIAKAISLAKPGDNIRLAKTGKDYLQSIPFSNRSGTAQAPITVYGNNAVLNGSDKLNPADWKKVGPGLYKNDTLYKKHRFNRDIIARYFFVMDGKLNSMNRCMKGQSAPLKKKEDLKSNEWTFVEPEKTFYLKVDPVKELAEYDIRVPIRMNGVSLHHQSNYIVIRDITAKNFVNDGYGLSGDGRHNKLINIATIDCGDDGISAHKNSGATIDGFYSSGNGTGICDTGNSHTVYNNVVIENIRGVDLYFLQELKGRAYHKMSNTLVKANGSKQFMVITNQPGASQQAVFDNLIFIGKKSGDSFVRLYGNTDIEIVNSTVLNMDWVAYMQRLSITNSLLTDRNNGINCKKGAILKTANDILGLRHIRFDKTYYSGLTPANLKKFQGFTGDTTSKFVKAADVSGISIGGIGADISKFPAGPLKAKAEKLLGTKAVNSSTPENTTPAVTAKSPVDSQKESCNVFVSSGDNHWLGSSLAMDSPESIHDALEMLRDTLGMKIFYWRGLQEAAWAYTAVPRNENFRYATFHVWSHYLIKEKKLEPMLVGIAKKLGISVWGVSTLGDWGSTADTPCFNDFPFNNESKLRLDHPEWVPIDKYGKRRQGGTIELAYPEARKALIDLHVKLAEEAGYAGIIFLTYVENFSLRFEDEFGYSEPIVKEFKKRYGIDIRHQPFNRYASKYDWHRLRGEYVTAYFSELKAELNKIGVKLGVMLNPDRPNYPMTWATLPHTHPTIGAMYMDYNTWIRRGIVDKLVVYGGSSRRSQKRTAKELLWLGRGTPLKVGVITSSPFGADWDSSRKQGIEIIAAHNEDENWLRIGRIPEQTAAVLKNGGKYQKMRFLAQLATGKSKLKSAELVIPLAKSNNIVMRRMALLALGRIGDPVAIPVIEAALNSKEVGIRASAMKALWHLSGPDSLDKAIAAIDKLGTHPDWEMARAFMSRMQPFPRQKLAEYAKSHPNKDIRNMCLRMLEPRPHPSLMKLYEQTIKDPSLYCRYTTAQALARMNSKEAVELLLKLTKHPDASVRNRAIISLGQQVKHNFPPAMDRKAEIIAAMVAAFRNLGDGKKPSDIEWGYRSIGEGLLYCGKDGEKALEQMMNNGSDKQLADFAWRILAYREKTDHEANYFNLICEHENDKLYAMRPAILKDQTINLMAQDFENISLFNPQTSKYIGVSSNPAGRWGYFIAKGPVVSTGKAFSGKQSLHLKRGGDSITGWINKGIPEGSDFIIEAMVYREKNGSFLMYAGSVGGQRLGIYVNPDGKVLMQDFAAKKWQPTQCEVPVDKWVKISLLSNALDNTYLVKVDKVTARKRLPIAGEGAIYKVSFTPQGRTAGIGAYIDDVKILEKR